MQGTVPSATEMQQHWAWTWYLWKTRCTVKLGTVIHQENGTPPCKGEHSAYSSIYSCTQDTVEIKKYVVYTEKVTKGTLLLGIWSDQQNTESTWCSRIFMEKSSTMNICITTSPRLAAERHSSSLSEFFGGYILIRCALGGPLHVTTHTFATKSSSNHRAPPSPQTASFHPT